MKFLPRIIGIGFAIAILSACQTNQAIYEAGLKDKDENLSTSQYQSQQIANVPSTDSEQDENNLEESYDYNNLQPGERPPLDTDEAGLWLLMDRQEKSMRGAGNVITNEAVNKYVQGIVCKLAANFCKDFRVYVVNVPEFNATMAPNGVMQIWSGLLLRARNEAQLATVIGHEIGHYLRRHSLQRMRSTMNAQNFVIFFQLASAAAGIPLAGNIAAAIASGNLSAYSRDHEREADGYGLRFLLDNGYDAREAPKIWTQLIKELEADDEYVNSSIFFASHPPSEERRDTLIKISNREMKKQKVADTGRDRYLTFLLPIRAGLLRDELNQRRYARTENLIQQLIEDGANIGELYFFKGELHRLRADNGDYELAISSYKTALTNPGSPVETHRSIGLVYLKQNKNSKAKEAFAKYIQLNPSADDKEIITQMMETL